MAPRTPTRARRLAAPLALLLLGAGGAAAAEPAALPVVEIAPDVYVHQGRHEDIAPGNRGDIANLGFVIGEEAVAVIDSGGSAQVGAALLAAVRRVTDLPVRWLVSSHGHPDHVFGNAVFRDAGATLVGHANLPRALAARGAYYLERLRETLGAGAAGSVAVPPDVTVEAGDSLELGLGGRSLTVTAWPTAHTDADVTVLDPASGTLWAGDLLFMERTPVIDGSLNGWLAVMERLRALPAARVVPGHGPPSAPWPQALEAQGAYLRQLRDELRAILAEGGTLEQALATAGRGHAGDWQLFEESNARNVLAAFTELEWE